MYAAIIHKNGRQVHVAYSTTDFGATCLALDYIDDEVSACNGEHIDFDYDIEFFNPDDF